MQTKLRSDAFLQQAMDTCGDAVYRLALCRLNSRADAEDVYQEVFLRLLRDDTDFRDTEHLKAWLLRVTLSRCADLRRSAWFKRTAPMEAAADAAAPVRKSGAGSMTAGRCEKTARSGTGTTWAAAAGMISGCCRVSRSLRQALCGTVSLPRHSLCCTI